MIFIILWFSNDYYIFEDLLLSSLKNEEDTKICQFINLFTTIKQHSKKNMEKLQNMKNFVGGISYFVYNCLKMEHKGE